MRKALNIILDLITAVCLIGTGILHYFGERKMGMIRWMNFHNARIEEQFVVDNLKYVLIGIIAILIAVSVMKLKKKWNRNGVYNKVMTVILFAMMAGLLFLLLGLSTSDVLGYYFFISLLSLGVVLQFASYMIRK